MGEAKRRREAGVSKPKGPGYKKNQSRKPKGPGESYQERIHRLEREAKAMR